MMMFGTVGVVIVLEGGLLIDTSQRSNEMTQQIKDILDNLLFKCEDAEDDIVIIQTKFKQMEAQLKEAKFTINLLNMNLELNDELLKEKDDEIDRLHAESNGLLDK